MWLIYLLLIVVLILCYLIYREISRQKETELKLGWSADSLKTSAEGLEGITHSVDKEVAKLIEQMKYQKEIRDEVKAMRDVIIGTTTRGLAGEKLLRKILSTLPPPMIEHNLKLSDGTVEFGLRFPDGKYLPIDSKFPMPKDFERFSEMEDHEKLKIIKDISSDFKKKINEASKYVNDERTVSFVLAAFPDSIYFIINDNHPEQISEAFRRNVIATSYSNTQQILLAVLQIREFYGVEVDIERLLTNIDIIKNLTNEIDEIVENKLSRSSTMIENAIRDLRRKMDGIKGKIENIKAKAE